jgi:tagaturonate epimerase
MILDKYTFGVGDRFSHQGNAQLMAMIMAKRQGLNIVPVWNKSNREHKIVKSVPADTRREADAAVKALDWKNNYFVDADHINLSNVDGFLPHCDFFTIDVADYISKQAPQEEIDAFIQSQADFLGKFSIPGIQREFDITKDLLRTIAGKFLLAMKEAGKIYKYIEAKKGKGNFVAEVSIDECQDPQTPLELLFILSMLAREGVKLYTIAPKFTGRFNKGVDYEGDVNKFAQEFDEDLAVITFAVQRFGFSKSLKLSVHSGSDKFSIYSSIQKAIKKHDAGLHIKTAGTTWLEELTGLAMGGGVGLVLAKEIYEKALLKYDELCTPYATVINIDKQLLPKAEEVKSWDGKTFADTLRHDQSNKLYNPHFRQLLHCGYKIAADFGETYTKNLVKYNDIIARNVTENLYQKHIRPIFGLEKNFSELEGKQSESLKK